ncbi:MAG: hypothetical protein VX346_07065 [Planctomycetota bacterium]|nr:hypothetical protein [Planctomycetota bacterium]
MISIRSFRNDDLRAIAEIWNHQTHSRGRYQPMTCQVFEREVLSKPYFDRHDFIVAVADGVPVGFVHAGYAGDFDGRRLSSDLGIICALQVLPRPDRDQIGEQLLRCAEQGLVSGGARNLQGGCMRNVAPFYGGLYGGCVASGVLASDQLFLDWLVRAGYAIRDERLIYQRSVESFRPAAQRTQVQLRRRHLIDVADDLPALTWWEACQRGNAHVTRLRLVPRDVPTQAITALSLWEPTGLAVERTIAIVDWDSGCTGTEDSVAEFFVGEAMVHCGRQGANTIEIQVTAGDRRGQDLVECLGFEVVDRGLCLVRPAHL